MPDALPIVLVPGLTCSARLYAEQIPALWQFGPVTVADHTRDDGMASIARRILAGAPPRFALAGLSMGGYIAFEILRQAPQRVARLALLDTGARLVMIADCGHLSTLEQPEKVTAALVDWMKW
jgi:pimeloyl-ACP methyl ester carboxylesterase